MRTSTRSVVRFWVRFSTQNPSTPSTASTARESEAPTRSQRLVVHVDSERPRGGLRSCMV